MSSFSILVVEDDATFLRVLVALLRFEGHRVVQAAGAREAIELLREETFEVVIVDWLMPEITGVELFVWIENNCDRYTGCILISGAADQVIREVARGDRMRLALLAKPFEKDELFQLIEQIGENVRRRRRLAVLRRP